MRTTPAISSLKKIQRRYVKALQALLEAHISEEKDPFAECPGQEYAKRAILVAAVSYNPVVLFGSYGCGQGFLAAAAARLGVPVLIDSPCGCGNFGDARLPCSCTPGGVERHRRRLLKVCPRLAIWVRLMFQSDREISAWRNGRRGVSLPEIEDRARSAREVAASWDLDGPCSRLMAGAADNLGLSLDEQEFFIGVAGDVARLDGSSLIGIHHLTEALQYRCLIR